MVLTGDDPRRVMKGAALSRRLSGVVFVLVLAASLLILPRATAGYADRPGAGTDRDDRSGAAAEKRFY